jgi:translocation and assembly module TamB
MDRLRTLLLAARTGAIRTFMVVAGLFLGVLLALMVWMQSGSSLAQALRLAATLLPAGQVLQASEVEGSLRNGGRIGHLLWKKDALTVEFSDVEMAWYWPALLDREWRVNTLHVRQLQVQDHRPPSHSPMADLVLPLRADVQFDVDTVQWAGPLALTLEAVRGRYRFDGSAHHLQDTSLQMAQGVYRLDADLQARQPMALSLHASGDVQAVVTARQEPLQLEVGATVQGTLFGPAAELDAQLQVQPRDAARAHMVDTMQAQLEARLRPGQEQPVERAHGKWSALDLASLWPDAPHTSLSGQMEVEPSGSAWKGHLQMQNSLTGTLDQHRMPLQSADASLVYHDNQWLLSALQATGAGGSVQAQGSYAGQPQRWSVSGRLQDIAPQKMHSHWIGPPLSGSVTAEQTSQGIGFDLAVAAAPQTRSISAAITRLQAQGRWSAPRVQFDKLLLEGGTAQVAGQLQVNTSTFASTGHLRANLPGALLVLDGSAAPDAGQGEATLQVRDAQALQQWLGSVPVLGPRLQGGSAVRGAADLSARWSGGWHGLGADLRLQGAASARQLDIDDQRLTDLQLDVNGSLRALELTWRGKAQQGLGQVTLQAGAHVEQVQAGRWHARLDQLQAALSDGLQNTPWTVQLQQPVDLEWQQAAAERSLSVASGVLRLSGPVPGNARIEWQPMQWSQQSAASKSNTGAGVRWSSRGQLQGVPLAWLELLGQTRIANLGLQGDLLFGGAWDASADNATGKGLLLNASLQRSSGDLQLSPREPGAAPVAAGLRDASVQLHLEREKLHAELLWASDAAGNARATFDTRLQWSGGSVVWAADAPVQGSVRASLPRVGGWSMVAPVGWRMQGTLEADATLFGTHASPQWKGQVEARELAIRSVVDGLDFSNGVLRLQINGQHMQITEFTLQGAGGPAEGKLQVTGSVDWLPGTASAPLAARVRMALDAQAQAFRVTARPDQRLVVSGKLNAKLVDARLTVRGALVADQASIVLPEDTAPVLGPDVVVRKPKLAANAAALKKASAPAQTAQVVVPDLEITLNPGTNFQLKGRGVNTQLVGLLTLKAEGRDVVPRLTGELRTVNGNYRAYGQYLTIEDGTLRFSGAYDNPAVEIRAVRPNLSQVVGVQVSGTAQLPVVRLFSEPDLPDAEKLSWLVLGHASTNGGAETAMLQQAALALLSNRGGAPTGNLFQTLGLDDVTLNHVATTTNPDNTTGSDTSLTLGKRISKDFYVAYERSLATAMGTFYVFYDLSRRFTLRGQAGEQSAVDLIFTARYD